MTPITTVAQSPWDNPTLPPLDVIARGDLESLIDHANKVFLEYRAKFLDTSNPLITSQVAQYSKQIRQILEIIRTRYGNVLAHLPLGLPDDMRTDFEDLLAIDHADIFNPDLVDVIH